MSELYDCDVVAIRSAGSCDTPHPVCRDSGGVGSTFRLQISGNKVTWMDCFSCFGTWSGGDFSCLLDNGVTTAGGSPCLPQQWVVQHQDLSGRPLKAGEIYAGIVVNNMFRYPFMAQCAPH